MTINARNFARFARQLEQEVQVRTVAEPLAVQKQVVLRAFDVYVRRWPRDTGHLAANSQLTVGAPAEAEIPGTDIPTEAAAAGALATLAPGSAVYLTNTAPYAEFVDAGSSDQAPQGVTDATVQEVLSIFP